MPENEQYSLSSNQITASIGVNTILISLDWHDFLEGEKGLNSAVSKNKELKTGVVNNFKAIYQVAFLPDTCRGSISPIPSIIENIILNNNINGLWFFVHEIDEDLIWYFVADENGHLDVNTDQVITKSSFYDILDEYILVADQQTQMFTSNFELPREFNEDVIESIISTGVLLRIIGQSRAVSLGKKKILGLPPYLFISLSISAIFSIIYFVLSTIISPLTQALSHQNLPRAVKAKDHIEWDKIREVLSDSRSYSFIENQVVKTTLDIPINIKGWDARSITFTPTTTTIIYTSSATSRIPLSSFLNTILTKYQSSSILDGNFSIDNFQATPSRKEVKVEWTSDYIEKIAGFSSIADYKRFLGEDVREEKIKKAKELKKEYGRIKTDITQILNKYSDKNTFELIYLEIAGDYELDTRRLISMSRALDLKKNQYMDLLKIIKKPIVPNPAILDSITMIKGDIDKLFDFTKKTALIDIKQKRQEAKSGLIISTFNNSGIGLNKMIKSIEFLKEYLPIRVSKVSYDWMTSKWTLDGVIYED